MPDVISVHQMPCNGETMDMTPAKGDAPWSGVWDGAEIVIRSDQLNHLA
jgi:hypothetical protein